MGDANITSLPTYGSQPIPSHYYAVVLQCEEGSADCTSFADNPLSFILPHKNSTQTCMTPKDYTFDHRARIRDIELLTDLHFLTSSHTRESVLTRTYYPEDLL